MVNAKYEKIIFIIILFIPSIVLAGGPNMPDGYRRLIDIGERHDLTGGGLIRSSGGWSAIKSIRRSNLHFKSDERILGDSDFVDRVLKDADEALERKYHLHAEGYDINNLSARVAEIFQMKPEEMFLPGKQPVRVKARSLLCYWAVRELGHTMADLSKMLTISPPAVSMSVRRGEGIAEENGYILVE